MKSLSNHSYGLRLDNVSFSYQALTHLSLLVRILSKNYSLTTNDKASVLLEYFCQTNPRLYRTLKGVNNFSSYKNEHKEIATALPIFQFCEVKPNTYEITSISEDYCLLKKEYQPNYVELTTHSAFNFLVVLPTFLALVIASFGYIELSKDIFILPQVVLGVTFILIALGFVLYGGSRAISFWVIRFKDIKIVHHLHFFLSASVSLFFLSILFIQIVRFSNPSLENCVLLLLAVPFSVLIPFFHNWLFYVRKVDEKVESRSIRVY